MLAMLHLFCFLFQASFGSEVESRQKEVEKGGEARTGLASQSLESRVVRLETLARDRQDLVEAYRDHLLVDHTILDSLNRHVVKMLRSWPFFPITDKECYWDLFRERCEPHCLCSFQYKFGDLHPGRACRLVHKQPLKAITDTRAVSVNTCDPQQTINGPIRKALRALKRSLHNVIGWIKSVNTQKAAAIGSGKEE